MATKVPTGVGNNTTRYTKSKGDYAKIVELYGGYVMYDDFTEACGEEYTSGADYILSNPLGTFSTVEELEELISRCTAGEQEHYGSALFGPYFVCNYDQDGGTVADRIHKFQVVGYGKDIEFIEYVNFRVYMKTVYDELTASITIPSEITAGKSFDVTWSATCDIELTAKATKLVRYLKAKDATTYTATTVFSGSTTNPSFTDTLSVEAKDSSIYYELTLTDDHSTITVTSATSSVINCPPVISGSDGDIGSFAHSAPSYSYAVTHEYSLSTSVTESFDGNVIRTYTASLGAQNTLSIPASVWLKTLNGDHTITIAATDSEGKTVTRTLTLTKNVTSLSFTLATPLDADAQITKAIEHIIAGIADGATITIEICNNGYDTSPTWEDVTQKVLNGEKFFFENATKTADKWGYNVRVNMERNSAAGECYVFSMAGFFE